MPLRVVIRPLLKQVHFLDGLRLKDFPITLDHLHRLRHIRNDHIYEVAKHEKTVLDCHRKDDDVSPGPPAFLPIHKEAEEGRLLIDWQRVKILLGAHLILLFEVAGEEEHAEVDGDGDERDEVKCHKEQVLSRARDFVPAVSAIL